MSQVIRMGMEFPEGSVPDFGSIYAVKLNGGVNFKGVNEYGLDETDVSKLDLITNASPGSTALCDDTGNLYRLTLSGWVKFGGEDATRTLSMSPLNINRSEITSDIGESPAEIEPSAEDLR